MGTTITLLTTGTMVTMGIAVTMAITRTTLPPGIRTTSVVRSTSSTGTTAGPRGVTTATGRGIPATASARIATDPMPETSIRV
jgi:hypothetical protein